MKRYGSMPQDILEKICNVKSDETEIMIGASNGSKISLTDQEISPSQIKVKMRKH